MPPKPPTTPTQRAQQRHNPAEERETRLRGRLHHLWRCGAAPPRLRRYSCQHVPCRCCRRIAHASFSISKELSRGYMCARAHHLTRCVMCHALRNVPLSGSWCLQRAASAHFDREWHPCVITRRARCSAPPPAYTCCYGAALSDSASQRFCVKCSTLLVHGDTCTGRLRRPAKISHLASKCVAGANARCVL